MDNTGAFGLAYNTTDTLGLLSTLPDQIQADP